MLDHLSIDEYYNTNKNYNKLCRASQQQSPTLTGKFFKSTNSPSLLIDKNAAEASTASSHSKFFLLDQNNNSQTLSNLNNQQITITTECDTQLTTATINTTTININVYLLAECCFKQLITETAGENLIDLDNHEEDERRHIVKLVEKEDEEEGICLPFSSELLEHWSISMVTNKRSNEPTANNISKSLLSINELLQAIRSYLHFSQISSWINQTKGKEPKHLAFR